MANTGNADIIRAIFWQGGEDVCKKPHAKTYDYRGYVIDAARAIYIELEEYGFASFIFEPGNGTSYDVCIAPRRPHSKEFVVSLPNFGKSMILPAFGFAHISYVGEKLNWDIRSPSTLVIADLFNAITELIARDGMPAQPFTEDLSD